MKKIPCPAKAGARAEPFQWAAGCRTIPQPVFHRLWLSGKFFEEGPRRGDGRHRGSASAIRSFLVSCRWRPAGRYELRRRRWRQPAAGV